MKRLKVNHKKSVPAWQDVGTSLAESRYYPGMKMAETPMVLGFVNTNYINNINIAGGLLTVGPCE